LTFRGWSTSKKLCIKICCLIETFLLRVVPPADYDAPVDNAIRMIKLKINKNDCIFKGG
jgi:hypothetical protein